MRPLPPACRWIDSHEASHLYWNYGCIAIVYSDGRVRIQWGQCEPIESRAACLAQGKRHVERWVSARGGWPPGKRAMAMRERVRAVNAARITPRPSRDP